MRFFSHGLLFAVSLGACLAAMPASATPITFHLDGAVCSTACGNIGLSTGQAMSASIVVDSSLTGIGTHLGAADLEDFSFTAGDVTLTMASAAYFNFSGTVTAAGIDNFFFEAADKIYPQTGDAFSINGGTVSVGHQGYKGSQSYEGVGISRPTQGSAGAFVSDAPAPSGGGVPEPATLALFGAGLAALARRRPRR